MSLANFVSILLLPLLLVGCGGGGSQEELRSWMREATKGMQGRIPPLPEVKPYEAAIYSAETLPDPFKPGRLDPEGKARRGSGKLQPDFEARELRNNPLERFPLESLNMIGYIKIDKVPYAIVVVDKLVKQVKIGEYVGQDFGIVIQVSDTEATIRELVQDSAGDWSERTSTLMLQEKSDKKESK